MGLPVSCLPQSPPKLEVAYSVPNTALSLHEPVLLDIAIKNNDPEAADFYLGQDKKEAFVFAITKPNGSRTELPPLFHMGLSEIGSVHLEPGARFTKELLLNEWSDFAEQGTYTVEVHLEPAVIEVPAAAYLPKELAQTTSSVLDGARYTFAIQIGPRDPVRLDRICRSLLRQVLSADSISEQSVAAKKLSIVDDPIAVTYLEQMLSHQRMEVLAVNGLERIGDVNAAKALIRALKTQPPGTVNDLIRPALRRVSARTADENVKAIVQGALAGN